MSSSASLSFGSYDWICSRGALIVCPLLGSTSYGIEPECYSRNVQFGRTLVFQPATSFLHICALLMVIIMILHIRSKYTAVGRKEILIFFYMYFGEEILAIFLDSAIIPTSSPVYPWFAAIHFGLTCAIYWCLLVNGFVGFQVVEDGTRLSLWILQGTSAVVGLIAGLIAIGTFKNAAGLSSAKPTGLWVLQFIFNLACVVIYIVAQLLLVLRTLDDRWPVGDIIFGTAFWVIGQVLLFAFSNTICDAVSHYLDGTFFNSLCMLLAVMMVYKFWDSITKEDLEFSVGSKANVWEVKDPLLLKDDDASPSSAYGSSANVAAGYPPQKYAPY
ncbi:Chitin synthase, class 7 [Rhodotorula mucilaginosa]|uniref:Chitin synthase export chaperone n=1 Tax=Rhodotorula mucilaginosa TaxID=5537 RepID=A0A9P7B733_RHOMI|nr:Chitin synthase, class 7 [Rhodotorula mucilaginosa]